MQHLTPENDVYEALMEGRYQPTVNVSRVENGEYLAYFESPLGVRVESRGSDYSDAYRKCFDKVIDGVRSGDIHPFR